MPRSPIRIAIPVLLAAVVAVSATPGAGAQNADGFFDRSDRRLGFELDGRLESAAWADVDGDGDPDVLTVGADGAMTLWRNEGGERLVARPLDGPEEPILGARFLDADRDGDQDLLTTGSQGPELLWVNGAGALTDPVIYRQTKTLAHQALDVDGDGFLDLYVGSAEDGEEASSGIVVRRGAGYAAASIVGFLPGENQNIVSLYRAAVDDPLELYSGGASFPSHRFSFSEAGPEYLGVVQGGTSDVRDVLIGDFDGDLVGELMLVRSDNDAAMAISEDEREITFLMTANDSVSSVTLGGEAPLRVEIEDSAGLATFAIQFGAERRQADSYEFVLDGSEGPASTIVRGIDTGLFISSPDDDRFRFVLAGTDAVRAQIKVTALEELAVVDTVGLPSGGGATFDQFYERSGDGWVVGQLLPQSTECSAGAAGDFDNDMDLDVYLACGNAIEKTPNRLFLNSPDGGFREVALGDGELATMNGSNGVAVADYDSDGSLDLLVQSSGGDGIFGRSAILRGLPNDNHWLGVDLVGRESSSDAIGAVLVFETAGVVQRRDVLGGHHGRSQDDTRVHIGLGPNEVMERLTVHWPSGVRQVVDDIVADQYLVLGEPSADTPYADIRLDDLRVEPVARSGDRLEVEATAVNIGTQSAENAAIVFELPDGWRAVGVPPEVTTDGATVTWPLPAVAPSQEVVVRLAIEIVSPSGPGEVEVVLTGDFPRNGMSAAVVTGDSAERRFGGAWLLLALIAGGAVLSASAWFALRRR